MDGEPLYKITRVFVRRGLIVGFRISITAGKQQVEDKTLIHIADIQTITEEFLQRQQKNPGDHYGGTGGDALTAGMGVMLQKPEPEVSYPKCGKKGHTAAQCWMRKREQEKAKLKRAGRSRDFMRSSRESSRKAPSLAPTRRRSPCYVCGSSIVPLSVLIEQSHPLSS